MSNLDWGQFGLEYTDPTPEEEIEARQREAERSELATIRADYQWIKECEFLSIGKLREIIAGGPFPGDNLDEQGKQHYLKRHRQAQIVLQARGGDR